MKSFIPIIISIFCAFNLRAATPPQTEQNPPLDPKNMDTSVKPGDDFFRYANGAWIKRTEIPPEYSRWGAFNELIERNNDALHVIAEQASKTQVDPKLAPETQKVGDYYASGIDEKTIDASLAQVRMRRTARATLRRRCRAGSACPIATITRSRTPT